MKLRPHAFQTMTPAMQRSTQIVDHTMGKVMPGGAHVGIVHFGSYALPRSGRDALSGENQRDCFAMKRNQPAAVTVASRGSTVVSIFDAGFMIHCAKTFIMMSCVRMPRYVLLICPQSVSPAFAVGAGGAAAASAGSPAATGVAAASSAGLALSASSAGVLNHRAGARARPGLRRRAEGGRRGSRSADAAAAMLRRRRGRMAPGLGLGLRWGWGSGWVSGGA
mmetsp:Transcript_28146/g.89969  ORF Transcript_28146/g.89969 Transcript_28146/m.89969 type:complete len:222 (-) Transcript_28146:22-687(-)